MDPKLLEMFTRELRKKPKNVPIVTLAETLYKKLKAKGVMVPFAHINTTLQRLNRSMPGYADNRGKGQKKKGLPSLQGLVFEECEAALAGNRPVQFDALAKKAKGLFGERAKPKSVMSAIYRFGQESGKKIAVERTQRNPLSIRALFEIKKRVKDYKEPGSTLHKWRRPKA